MDPEELGPAGRAALAACRDHLPADQLARRAAIVEAYVLAADQLARLQAEHRRLGHPALVAGARGHVAAHPLLGELRRQANHVRELAQALGLARSSPRSMVGQNLRAPDRTAPLRRAS